jgi:hypothetical protein
MLIITPGTGAKEAKDCCTRHKKAGGALWHFSWPKLRLGETHASFGVLFWDSEFDIASGCFGC